MDRQGRWYSPSSSLGEPACEPGLPRGSCLDSDGGLAGVLQRWTLCFLPVKLQHLGAEACELPLQ